MRDLAESLTPCAARRQTFSTAPCDSARWCCRLGNNVLRCFSDSKQSDHRPVSFQKSEIVRICYLKKHFFLTNCFTFEAMCKCFLASCLRCGRCVTRSQGWRDATASAAWGRRREIVISANCAVCSKLSEKSAFVIPKPATFQTRK